MSRPAPDLCEVCGASPPKSGIGFPAYPPWFPHLAKLPRHLWGGAIYICGDPACDLAAQKRAAKAAASAGITLKTIWRHNLIRTTQDQYERKAP